MTIGETLTIGDSVYTVDAAYMAGVNAFKRGVSFHYNPYRWGSVKSDSWEYGHIHESEGLHQLFCQ